MSSGSLWVLETRAVRALRNRGGREAGGVGRLCGLLFVGLGGGSEDSGQVKVRGREVTTLQTSGRITVTVGFEVELELV